MARKLTIKQIALLAGVSPGTVDRVLHNRGNVSMEALERVRAVLSVNGYRYNIHTSAVSLKKEFNLAVVIPAAAEGEYWNQVREGFDKALEEYSDIDIDCHYYLFDLFDPGSCAPLFDRMLKDCPDAVLCATTFREPTVRLCGSLDARGIPYVFVDNMIEGTHPLACFSVDQREAGRLMARLLEMTAPGDCAYVVFRPYRAGGQDSATCEARENAFRSYFASMPSPPVIKSCTYYASDPSETLKSVSSFMKDNPDVCGAAVFTSSGHAVARAFREAGVQNVCLASFDVTSFNVSCLRDGSLSFLLGQRPDRQGFSAIEAVIRHLLYRPAVRNVINILPIDIVLKENLASYLDSVSVA